MYKGTSFFFSFHSNHFAHVLPLHRGPYFCPRGLKGWSLLLWNKKKMSQHNQTHWILAPQKKWNHDMESCFKHVFFIMKKVMKVIRKAYSSCPSSAAVILIESWIVRREKSMDPNVDPKDLK